MNGNGKKKENLEKILKLNPKFETLFTKILAEDLANVLMNQQNLKEQSAKERYLSLDQSRPDALQRIPIKCIAGYLGIAPESIAACAVVWQEKTNNLS